MDYSVFCCLCSVWCWPLLGTVDGLCILLGMCKSSSWWVYVFSWTEGVFSCWASKLSRCSLWTVWFVFRAHSLLLTLILSLMPECNFFPQPHELFHETVRSLSVDSGRFGWPFYRGNWRTWVETLVWPYEIGKYLTQ